MPSEENQDNTLQHSATLNGAVLNTGVFDQNFIRLSIKNKGITYTDDRKDSRECKSNERKNVFKKSSLNPCTVPSFTKGPIFKRSVLQNNAPDSASK